MGNNARHLIDQIDLNRPIYSASATAANVNSRRPILPGTYAEIANLEPGDNSTYNALAVTVNRRFSRGFTLLANYTYSKAMDVNDTDPGKRHRSFHSRIPAIRQRRLGTLPSYDLCADF